MFFYSLFCVYIVKAYFLPDRWIIIFTIWLTEVEVLIFGITMLLFNYSHDIVLNIFFLFWICGCMFCKYSLFCVCIFKANFCPDQCIGSRLKANAVPTVSFLDFKASNNTKNSTLSTNYVNTNRMCMDDENNVVVKAHEVSIDLSHILTNSNTEMVELVSNRTRIICIFEPFLVDFILLSYIWARFSSTNSDDHRAARNIAKLKSDIALLQLENRKI